MIIKAVKKIKCAECGKEHRQRIDHANRSELNFCTKKCANIYNAKVNKGRPRGPRGKNKRVIEDLELVESGKIKGKVCKKCGEFKTFDQYHKSPTERFGYRSMCKICRNSENRKHDRRYNLNSKYKMTIDDYDKILEKQIFSCAICGGKEPKSNYGRFLIDHDHKNGKIRGLLCQPCNTGLGQFEDNIQKLNDAINYLNKGEIDCPLEK